MKKTITIILAVILVAALFAGCANEQDKLVGTWKGEMDLSEALTKYIGAEDLGGAEEYFNFSDFKVTAILTFNEDGTYSMALEEASVQTAFDTLIEDLRDAMVKMLEDQITALGVQMTVDEMLAASGMTMDSLMEELKKGFEEEGIVDSVIEEAASEGNFKVKDGKLYMSDGKEYAVDENIYDNYTLEGSTLTLVDHVGDDTEDLEDVVVDIYPMVFEKVN